MSSQTRIDSYFKSTSGKQQSVKVLSRSKSGNNLSKKGPGKSRSLRNPTFAKHATEKKTSQTWHRTQDTSANNVYSIHTSPDDTSITDDQSNVEGHCNSVVNVTTPVKKTIKGFIKACNSPSVNSSPENISLKRRNQNSSKMSTPQKKSQFFHKNNISDDSEMHSANHTNLSRLPTSNKSSDLCEYFDENSVCDIIEVTDENSYKCHSQQSNVQLRVETCARELRNGNNSLEKYEKLPSCQGDNISANNKSYSEETETYITPKKRKIEDSRSPKNLPSSGWNVATSIETADVSMTALSNQWQKSHKASRDFEKSLVIAERSVSKGNVQVMPGNGRNYENVSEISASTRDTPCNAYAKKTSPRRSLFSPVQNSAKESVSATSVYTLSANTFVALPRNEENTSLQEIFQTTNLRTNENCNLTTKINEHSNLKKTITDHLKNCSEQNESSDFCIEVNETTISKGQRDKITNASTVIPKNITSPLVSPKKNLGSANSPIKVNGASSMLQNMTNSSTTPTKVNKTAISPKKRTGHLTSPTKSPSRSSQSSFSPRFKVSPREPPKERIDTFLATRAVENLNQTKQGIIPMNNFDLEMIYTKESFDFQYGSLNANTTIKYEAKDVQVPEEKHADHFFMVLVNVFSEALNCGYFDEAELDTVFSTLTLSPNAQSLLARMLKRKRGWHRVSSIKYPEIANDLTPVFKELVDNGFLDDDIANEDISKLLNVLQVDEIKAICQAMKRPKATKPTMISDLVKLANTKASLFPGIKSPSLVLRKKISTTLGLCIRLPKRIENLFNRIFILLIPNQDPKENMVEAFRMLIQVHFGEIRFPETPNERFPIFRNRLHLIRYAEARSAYTQILNASEAKDWETVRTLGQLAHDNLKPYFESNDTSDDTQYAKLPSHVKRYDPNYLWIRVMSKSVEGFKKTKESMAIAAEFLHTLVSPRNKIPGHRTRWYNELAMIESYHRKDFKTSAEITLKALMQENISDMDAAAIFERARKLCKSKAVSTDMKEQINAALSLKQQISIITSEPRVNEIEATMVPGNTTGSKSTWSVNINGADTGYVKVENVALRHYLCEGFRSGIHCEGALPITLFATLLWEEIYTIPVPGAFVSAYQDAPLDLYTSHFLEPRRERIENKLNFIRHLDLDSLSSMMHEDFVKYREYQSLVHGNLFPEPDHFKELIECLGIDAVVGICERLAKNYNQWKSGFPDLAVWNPDTKKCKIVEVKGPGDSLSTKQKMWIQFLETLGVEVEVCVVKGTTKRYAKFSECKED